MTFTGYKIPVEYSSVTSVPASTRLAVLTSHSPVLLVVTTTTGWQLWFSLLTTG